MQTTLFPNSRLALASLVGALTMAATAPGAMADCLPAGTTIRVTAQLNQDAPQSAVVLTDQGNNSNLGFSWQVPGDYINVNCNSYERFFLRLDGASAFSQADVLSIDYEVPADFTIIGAVITRGIPNVNAYFTDHHLGFTITAGLELISTVDGFDGIGASIELTAIFVNTSPKVTCIDPPPVECGPVTEQVTVTDPDPGQTLTVILKEGDVQLDQQTVSTPVNQAVVQFKPISFSQGTHSLTVSVSDGAASSTCSSTVAVQDTIPPVFTQPLPNLSATALGTAGATVIFPAPSIDDNCGLPGISYSPVSGSTFPPGITAVQCTLTDGAGNQTASGFVVNVTYAWSGVLQPINSDGSSVFKGGSTVPVKFQLTGVNAGSTTLPATLSFAKINNAVAGVVNEAISTSSASAGNLFRYDPTSGQYIFNWSTKNLTSGTYQLQINLGDGVTRTVCLGLR